MQSLSYAIHEITKIIKGELKAAADPNESITDILIDSRRLISPENCVFIALVTRKNDGHKYIKELYDKGIRNFILSDPGFIPENSNCIFVKNTLEFG